MKKEFQSLMMPKSKLHTWPCTTQPGQWQEFGATQWLFKFMDDPSITVSCKDAWLSSLVGRPGDVVAQQSSARILLILAVADFTFAAWDLEVLPSREGQEDRLLLCPYRNCAIDFHHVIDLADWLWIPRKPCLQGRFGPLVLEQQAEPLSLAMAELERGLALSVQQCKDLLQALGVSLKGLKARSRADFQNLLVDCLVESEEPCTYLAAIFSVCKFLASIPRTHMLCLGTFIADIH